MGIKATVIYDTPTHTVLVVRLPTFSLLHRYEIVDTISSFTAHCDSLRGVARSVSEVSAQWGGPPYITYTVVGSRLRCMVIWEQNPSELDLAYDVETCLRRLEKSVTPLVDQLAQHDPTALAIAYDQAGHALNGETPIIPDTAETKKQRPKLLAKAPSLHRRPSFADPKRKKSGKFFGKLGNVFKSVGGGEEATVEEDDLQSVSESSLRPPSEAAALSVAQYASEDSEAMKLAELQLPDEMFAWVDFDAESRPDDISWLVQLLHSEESVRPPNIPMLRAGSVTSSAPLTIPTMENQLDAEGSLESSVHSLVPKLPPAVEVAQGDSQSSRESVNPKPTTNGSLETASRKMSAPTRPASIPVSTTPLSTPQSNAVPTSAVPLSQASPTNKAPNQGEMPRHESTADGGSSAQMPGAQRMSVGTTTIESAVPNVGGRNMQGHAAMSGVRPSVPPNFRAAAVQSPLNTPSQTATAVSQGQMGIGMQSPMNPQPGVTQPAVAGASSGLRTPSLASSTQAGAQSPVPPSPMMKSEASSMLSPPTAPNTQSDGMGASMPLGNSGRGDIPPALAALQEESNFDVSGLGVLKDDAAVVAQGQAGRSLHPAGQSSGWSRAQREKEDEAIRTRMNEFAVSMQAGNFVLARQQVYATLKLLRQVQPRREQETITCANYVLAQNILIRNAVLEKELQRVIAGSVEAVRRHIESALLTMFLAEMKHLLPRHRVAAMQVAVEKNLIVGNYGMCARWLRQLLERAPERAKGELRSKLEACMRAGEKNAQMPMTNRLCYITLQVLGIPYGKCSVCGAVYHAQMAGVVQGQVCPTCLVGGIEAQMV